MRSSISKENLAREIQNNLYVGKLTLGAETAHELGKKSEAARTICNDMTINLLEFLSNNECLEEIVPVENGVNSQKV